MQSTPEFCPGYDFMIAYIAPAVMDELAEAVLDLDAGRTGLLKTLAVPDQMIGRLCRLLLG